ncbi:MAG: 4Fe-4S binding protein [Bacteroidota bacterium]
MALKITEECISCGACEPECPNHAIYEGGAEWRFSDGTALKGNYTDKKTGKTVNAESSQPAMSNDFYYIVTDKCTECNGSHDEPQCASVCPVDCCVSDADNAETKEQMITKKESLHA